VYIITCGIEYGSYKYIQDTRCSETENLKFEIYTSQWQKRMYYRSLRKIP